MSQPSRTLVSRGVSLTWQVVREIRSAAWKWLRALSGRPLRALHCVSKSEEFCIKNEDLCIKNEEFCIKNDEFCRDELFECGT